MSNFIIWLFFASLVNFLFADENIEKYKVKKGDYLCKIARNYYSNCEKWRIIYEANRDKIKDPDIILPNMILDVPVISTKSYSGDIEKITQEVKIEEIKKLDISNTDLTISSSNSMLLVQNSSLTVSTIVPSTQKIPIFSSDVIKTNIKNNDEKKQSTKPYQIIKKKLSASLPKEQVAFNLSSDRFEVERDFFCGEVIDGINDNELYIKGDVIDVKANMKIGNDISEFFIYSVVSDDGKKIVADKIAKCDIVMKENLNIKCIIDWYSFPVKKGMKVSIYGSK